MRLRQLATTLVVVGVVAAFFHSLGMRLPYMNQVPVFDGDGMTTEAHMWARMWWDEGPVNMWFSTPYAPRSIEAQTRSLYESFPSGSFIPVYLLAKLLGVEPNITMVNWLNTAEHGLIALATAFIAFNIALMNRLGKVASVLIAVGVTFPILFSRGPVYVFSQIYDTTNAVLIYTTAFILLETLFYGASSAREKRVITAAQLIIIFCAFFVDWLAYTVFAFWLLSRVAAGYFGVETRTRLSGLIGFALVPIAGFMIYLAWRLFAPDSSARTSGIKASLDHLFYKLMERMNLTDESHISGFGSAFVGEMHSLYYSGYAFPLIVGSSLLTLVLAGVAFHRARDPEQRRATFAIVSILFLATAPFYAHMLVLYQHTFIHRWDMMKAMFAYSLVPFALLPISIFSLLSSSRREYRVGQKFGLAILGFALALSAIICATSISTAHYFPLGRVDRTAYLMWDDIGRNTQYQDVVVSPVLRADPMTTQVGASYKLVHFAKDFSEVDSLVEHVCGDFNVVVALPEGTDAGPLVSRQPSQVVDTGRIRLLRFAHYQGKRVNCS